MVALNLTAAVTAATFYNIVSSFTNAVLDLSFASTANLNPIILDGLNGNSNQKVRLMKP